MKRNQAGSREKSAGKTVKIQKIDPPLKYSKLDCLKASLL